MAKDVMIGLIGGKVLKRDEGEYEFKVRVKVKRKTCLTSMLHKRKVVRTPNDCYEVSVYDGEDLYLSFVEEDKDVIEDLISRVALNIISRCLDVIYSDKKEDC